jgi:hypothetical protein
MHAGEGPQIRGVAFMSFLNLQNANRSGASRFGFAWTLKIGELLDLNYSKLIALCSGIELNVAPGFHASSSIVIYLGNLVTG